MLNNLQSAMKKKDLDEIAVAVKAIEKRIPPEKFTPEERTLLNKAKENVEKEDSGKSNAF